MNHHLLSGATSSKYICICLFFFSLTFIVSTITLFFHLSTFTLSAPLAVKPPQNKVVNPSLSCKEGLASALYDTY